MKLIVMKGIPGSGKSTYAKQWVNEDPKKRVRICRDDIRRMLGPYWLPSREGLVTEIENSSILDSLDKGYDVIVDACNIKGADRFKYLLFDIIHHVSIEIVDLSDVPLDICIDRDKCREGDEAIGEDVIRKMYKRIKS